MSNALLKPLCLSSCCRSSAPVLKGRPFQVAVGLVAVTSSRQLPSDPRQGSELEPKQGVYVDPRSARAKCGGSMTLTSGQEQVIKSPGYPKKYPNKKKCNWDISSDDPEAHIEVSCPNVDLKSSKSCKGDRLRLIDDQNVETICGRGERTFATKSNRLIASFRSNKFGRAKGFECTVRSVSSDTDSSVTYYTDSTDYTTKPLTSTPTTAKPTTAKPTTAKPTEPPTTKCQCGVANPNRIVGGMEVKPAHKYPWHVGLKKRGVMNYVCGGSIINDRYALTAAHCFFDKDGNRVSDEGLVVGVADHDMYSTSDDISGVTRLVAVEKVILHPSYSSSGYDYDIALLKLSEVLDLSKNKELRSVCLPADDSKSYAGATGIAAGWGRLESGGNQPEKLMEVTLPILETSCWGKSISERMLCAGYKEGGKDTCQGDSGGPLYVVESSKHFQVGVTSFGDGCANPNSPGVYARVSKFLDWIKTNTADANYC
ncbi:transmembrane protease serine 9-like [Penaeus japonicus]|uniref:transmembrane protease serine 9-like n=1 Tax=Penaeus japonicus TaxID=27405 RepID=UPI001C70E1E0|nr:transmembrane protease serine 9-like [Penaeus japonicus]